MTPLLLTPTIAGALLTYVAAPVPDIGAPV